MFGLKVVRQSDIDKLVADVSNDAIEAAAKIAETHITCNCGRPDCYSDRIPQSIASDIRMLK